MRSGNSDPPNQRCSPAWPHTSVRIANDFLDLVGKRSDEFREDDAADAIAAAKFGAYYWRAPTLIFSHVDAR